jgi:hypothetical protein
MKIAPDFESVAKMWLLGDKFKIVNVCTLAALWSVRKLRNEMIFRGCAGQGQRSCWSNVLRMV